MCVASRPLATSVSDPLVLVPFPRPARLALRSTWTSCESPSRFATYRGSLLFIDRFSNRSVRVSLGLSGEVKLSVRLNVLAGLAVLRSTRTSIPFPLKPSARAVSFNEGCAVSVTRSRKAAAAPLAKRTTQASVPPLRKNWRTE